MSNAIVASGLTRYHGDLLAVDHVDLEVQQGEIFGYLGPNGAGKTTTIRMLTGLMQPSEGTAEVNGFDIADNLIEVKRSIGVVPEVSNVYGGLTAWDNLLFAAELYKVGRNEREGRAEDLLRKFELYERRDSKAQGFSNGMKRRLTIAMAMIHQPGILFLDEPTTGLDIQSAVIVRDQIRQLKDEGVTVFLTTHYIEEADQLCDRVAILDHGRIVAYDTPEKLKGSILGVHTIEVAFDGDNSNGVDDLRALPYCDDVIEQGDKYLLFTQQPTEILPRIVDHAENNDLKIISLNTLKPRLEDVFLKMIGTKGM